MCVQTRDVLVLRAVACVLCRLARCGYLNSAVRLAVAKRVAEVVREIGVGGEGSDERRCVVIFCGDGLETELAAVVHHAQRATKHHQLVVGLAGTYSALVFRVEVGGWGLETLRAGARHVADDLNVNFVGLLVIGVTHAAAMLTRLPVGCGEPRVPCVLGTLDYAAASCDVEGLEGRFGDDERGLVEIVEQVVYGLVVYRVFGVVVECGDLAHTPVEENCWCHAVPFCPLAGFVYVGYSV